MDGQQKTVNASLQRKLSVWMAVAIVVMAVVAGVLSYFTALQEARELQDDVLRQVVHLVHRQGLAANPAPAGLEADIIDAESEVVIQILHPAAPERDNSTVWGIHFGGALADGLQTVDFAQESWRVLVKPAASGTLLLAAQRTTVRDEIARDAAMRAMLPLLVLMPLLTLVSTALVRTMLSPVKALATDLAGRKQEDLQPLPEERIPDEIRPFVTAINDLLNRVKGAMDQQRRFLADAAHELRTPLTALTLQAEQLASTEMPPSAQARVRTLMTGLSRARQLVEQLLTYARVRDARQDVARSTAVRAVARRVIEDLMPLAQARNIDLGMVGESDHSVRVSEADLRTLMANLVDNAVKYTPLGGKVDVIVRRFQGQVRLEVVDTGAGIAPDERERVLDPFYRGLGTDVIGSGLGLSIVQTIARRVSASLELAYADEERRQCLRVIVTLPSAEAGNA
ncbi:MAG: two-component sensor histidine kinase [Betaproteobacteria bacterium]|nr:two-component sensor histidine kinase [Betaproteobacteria bacterium]